MIVVRECAGEKRVGCTSTRLVARTQRSMGSAGPPCPLPRRSFYDQRGLDRGAKLVAVPVPGSLEMRARDFGYSVSVLG